MSGRYEWASARYTMVQGTAKPGEIERGEDSNEVAAIEFVYGSDGDSLTITGRPEELLALMRRGVEQAEAILLETVRTPELRRMYGDMAEASQLGTWLPGAPVESEPHGQKIVVKQTVIDTRPCEEAGQHVRSTRHTRWVCPFVTEVDVDGT